MSTMPGDSLLSAAFIGYAGYFDQTMRHNLFHAWTEHLLQANIKFRGDLARVEYLSTVDERMNWQSNSLPVDDLCTENAIMLKVDQRKNSYVDDMLIFFFLAFQSIPAHHWSIGTGHRVHSSTICWQEDHSNFLPWWCVQKESRKLSTIWKPTACPRCWELWSYSQPSTEQVS